jgi:hypothetical protein
MTLRDAQQAFIATAVQRTKTFTARLTRSSVGLDDSALFNSLATCDAVSASEEVQEFRRNAVGAFIFR